MTSFTKEKITSRSRTLLIAFLLSVPGPLVTGIAVLSSHSTTQLADFFRRTVELLVLFISWWIFQQIHTKADLSVEKQQKLERAAGLSVAGAMASTGILMLVVSFIRFPVFESGGNVFFGLVIAFLGLLTNSFFWWRYTQLTRDQYSSVIASQRDLYRAKAVVDFCVVAALAAVAIAPDLPATSYVDVLGSLIVAIYLLWSGLRMAKSHLGRDWKKVRPFQEYFRANWWFPLRKDAD